MQIDFIGLDAEGAKQRIEKWIIDETKETTTLRKLTYKAFVNGEDLSKIKCSDFDTYQTLARTYYYYLNKRRDLITSLKKDLEDSEDYEGHLAEIKKCYDYAWEFHDTNYGYHMMEEIKFNIDAIRNMKESKILFEHL